MRLAVGARREGIDEPCAVPAPRPAVDGARTPRRRCPVPIRSAAADGSSRRRPPMAPSRNVRSRSHSPAATARAASRTRDRGPGTAIVPRPRSAASTAVAARPRFPNRLQARAVAPAASAIGAVRLRLPTIAATKSARVAPPAARRTGRAGKRRTPREATEARASTIVRYPTLPTRAPAAARPAGPLELEGTEESGHLEERDPRIDDASGQKDSQQERPAALDDPGCAQGDQQRQKTDRWQDRERHAPARRAERRGPGSCQRDSEQDQRRASRSRRSPP